MPERLEVRVLNDAPWVVSLMDKIVDYESADESSILSRPTKSKKRSKYVNR